MRRPRPSTHRYRLRLRAGVPQAVIAEIGSRRRIVGLVGLHAVGDGIVADRSRGHRNNGAIIVVRVIVVVRPVVARPAIIGVARRERAAAHGTGNRAGEEAAAAAITVAAVPAPAIAAAITGDGWASAGAAKARNRGAAITARNRPGTRS